MEWTQRYRCRMGRDKCRGGRCAQRNLNSLIFEFVLKWVQIFLQKIRENAQVSPPVAAIQTLLTLIEHSKATTMSEFMQTLKKGSFISCRNTGKIIDLTFCSIAHSQGHYRSSDFSECRLWFVFTICYYYSQSWSGKSKHIAPALFWDELTPCRVSPPVKSIY